MGKWRSEKKSLLEKRGKGTNEQTHTYRKEEKSKSSFYFFFSPSHVGFVVCAYTHHLLSPPLAALGMHTAIGAPLPDKHFMWASFSLLYPIRCGFSLPIFTK